MLVHNNNILHSSYQTQGFIDWDLSIADTFRQANDQQLSYIDVVEYSHLDLLNMSFPWYDSTAKFTDKMENKIISQFNFLLWDVMNITAITKMPNDTEKWEKGLQFYITTNKKKLNLNYIAGGYIYFLKLIILLSIEIHEDKNIILIEEPEQQLNPRIQKLIPKFLKSLTDIYPDKQFFVTTHSPFVISAATKFDDQKVYRIENWECLNPNGSRWARVVFESARMLGMGMDDFIVAPLAHIKNKSYIVYCESNKVDGSSDAEIYNTIFRKYENVLFISCGRCEDVYHQYIASTEFYKTQAWQVQVIWLIDNDPDNNKIEEWKKIWLTVLWRREMENYLYDKEIVVKLPSSPSQKAIEKIQSINISTHDVKNDQIVSQQLDKRKMELAWCMTSETETYKELKKSIFW